MPDTNVLLGEWKYLPVPLDLSKAVTLVATAAARVSQSPPTTLGSLSVRTDRVIDCYVQDSLDGESWFTLRSGTLEPTRESVVKPSSLAFRVSEPLGVHLRVAWQVRCRRAEYQSDGVLRTWEPCSDAACATTHGHLETKGFVLNIAVRSI